MTHPSSLDLEAFACDDAGGESVATHVRACAACGAFVESLRALVASGPAATEADDAVARAMARNDVDVTRPQQRTGRGRLWLVTSSVVGPLAAAAAILLLTRSQPVPVPQPGPPAPSSNPAGGDRVLMGPAIPQRDPETTFKGGAQLAVVRERGTQQERFSSTVRVRRGDRIRVEVALDREQAILGAVLADDGSYLELMPEAVRGPGTHFSERSAKVDASPTRGTIIIGSPEAVVQARRTKDFSGVTTLRVEIEESP